VWLDRGRLGPPVQTAAVTVTPGQYLASWKPDAGTLFVPALSDAQLGEEAAVRVSLAGRTFQATLFGMVSLVRRVGRPSLPPGAELRLDADSRVAAQWLAAAARGDEIPFSQRAPRFVAEHALLAVRDRNQPPLAVTTTNVSVTGASLRWAGVLPKPGEAVVLRLGDGFLAPSAEAVVAWTVQSPSGPGRVGVRLMPSGRAQRAWEKIAAEAARTGARV
jgi:hypothetical protein